MNRSSQREAILDKLRSVSCHPTADELHAMLHEAMPHLSLATVYRNLEQLANAGMVLVLDGGNARRFDGNTAPHYHKRCRVCGKVSDIAHRDLHVFDSAIEALLPRLGCETYKVEFAGLCSGCNLERAALEK